MGGICGIIEHGTIENCIFDGTVILSSLSDSSIINLCAGGIVGLAGDETILNNCKAGYNAPTSIKATASSSGYVYAGGIAAVFCSGECTNNYSKVNLTGTNKGAIYALNTWDRINASISNKP